MRWLFKQFGNFSKDVKENLSLKEVSHNIFLLKNMFIESEYYTPGYGFDRLGGEIGRREDNYFFECIDLGYRNPKIEGKITDLIVSLINDLTERKENPTLIITAP